VADIFISYAREDRPFAEALAEALGRQGWSIWWDRKIQAGRSFSEIIERELAQARCVVAVWSQASINSDWVLNEAAEGADRKILIPLLIDDVRPPFEFRRLHAVSLHKRDVSDANPDFADCVAAIRALFGEEKRDVAPAPAPRRVKWRYVAAALMVMLIAAVVVWKWPRDPRAVVRTAPPPPAKTVPPPPPLIAGARAISRNSISWNHSMLGRFNLPPDPSSPIELEADAASWPDERSHDMTIFPRLSYAMSGDFNALTRVKVSGIPAPPRSGARVAGIGLVSRGANQMLLFGKALLPAGEEDVHANSWKVDAVSGKGLQHYLDGTKDCNSAGYVDLQIVKKNGSITVSCRAQGTEWRTVRRDFQLDFGTEATELFLFAYAADGRPVSASFTHFEVVQ
jgi:hypothetical protein